MKNKIQNKHLVFTGKMEHLFFAIFDRGVRINIKRYINNICQIANLDFILQIK